MSSQNPTAMRDMSRIRGEKGCRICQLCGIPFGFKYRSKRFCSARCRQRHHRGHRSLATITRAAAFHFNGHLSDLPDSTFFN